MASAEAESSSIGVFVGVYVAGILFGLTSLQTFMYFKSARMRQDKSVVKFTVVVLWILDIADSAIAPIVLWRVDISNPDDILSGGVYWAVSVSYLLEAFMEGIVRSPYCLRIWSLSNNSYILTVISAGFATVALLFSVWLASASFRLTPDSFRSYNIVTYAFVVSAVVADTVIATILVFLLWRFRKGSHFKKNTSLVNTLIVYTVSTGALTSLATVIVLIAFVASSGLAYGGVRLVVAKFYFNALLATLNQREALQKKLRKPGLFQTLEFTPDVGSTQNTNPITDSTSHEDSFAMTAGASRATNGEVKSGSHQPNEDMVESRHTGTVILEVAPLESIT